MKMRRGLGTEIGRRLVSSADTDYKGKAKEVRKTLVDIEKALKDHEKRQRGNQTSYSYVGDLGHIQSALLDVLRFLQG
jgi:hypothetical protein